LLPSFSSLWLSGFRVEDFLEIDQSENQKQELLVAAMFENASVQNKQSL